MSTDSSELRETLRHLLGLDGLFPLQAIVS